MIAIDAEEAKKLQKIARSFVDHEDYEDLKAAIINASPSGEGQSESTALICHGRLLATRDIFTLLKELARPAPKPEKSRSGVHNVDPDLEAD